jgi:fibronectin type 3 domain-containing protein
MARIISVVSSILIFALGVLSCEKTVRQENGYIAGTVTVDGGGVDGATVTVSSYAISSGNPKPSAEIFSARVSAKGDYRIELLPGRYRIDFDMTLGGEILHTARYPVEVSIGIETIVNVELKDPVPRNLIGGDDDASVLLTWESAYGALEYNVYRGLAAEETFRLVEVVDSTSWTISYVDTPPAIDNYKYKVTAISSQGESDPSETITVDFTGSISPPTGFQATDNITHVSLDWTTKPNATIYKIYRSASDSPGNWVVIDSVSESHYQDVPSVYDTYYYYITAVSYLGTESGPSTTKLVDFDGLFDPPTSVIAIDRGSSLYLTWMAEENIGYYNIYRSEIPDSDFVKIDSTFVPHYEDFPALFGNYYYGVTIVGPNGLESEMSEVVSAYFDGRLEPPDQVLATDLGLTVEVSWSQVLWAAAYIVYRSDDGGNTFNQIYRVSGEDLSKMDTPPQAGDYYYKIATETLDGTVGALSTAAYVYFSDNLPAPVNVSAENYGTFVEVAWEEVPGADGYTIHRATTPEGTYSQLGSSPVPEYTDVPQTAGAYYYKVRAVDNLGHASQYSFYAYTYFTDRPLAPFNVSAEDLSYRVRISWESIDSSFIFIIYRSGSAGGDYVPIDTVEAELEIIDWPPNTGHYYYKVQAEHPSHGSSDLSQYGHVYFSGILGTPSNLVVTNQGSYISITWDDVEGASEYEVFRGEDINQLSAIQTVYVSHTTDVPESAGTYYYAVLAKTVGGLESPRSAPVGVDFNP